MPTETPPYLQGGETRDQVVSVLPRRPDRVPLHLNGVKLGQTIKLLQEGDALGIGEKLLALKSFCVCFGG